MAPSVYFIFSTPLVYKNKLNRLFLSVCVSVTKSKNSLPQSIVCKKSNVSHKQTASNHTANNKKILVKKRRRRKRKQRIRASFRQDIILNIIPQIQYNLFTHTLHHMYYIRIKEILEYPIKLSNLLSNLSVMN